MDRSATMEFGMEPATDKAAAPAAGVMREALAFAAAGVLIHLFNGGYGYFRDELYVLDCGRHLDWGYVDHAPLIGWLAWLGAHTIGISLFAIHLPPALAAGAKILLTGLLVRELGGGRFAAALACLSVLVAPVYLAIDSMFSMNTFEPLFWMGGAWVLIRAVRRDEPQLLPWFGVLMGLGLLNKHSTAFFGAAVAAGLVLSPQRRWLRTRWPWIAAAVALALFLPNLIWQQQHNWPTLEDLANVRRTHKNVELGPAAFFARQLLVMMPFSAPVWLAGAWYFGFHREGRRYRLLGWTFAIFFAVLLALKGKDYYVAPAYPMMFAAGAVWWERWGRPWMRYSLAGLVAAGGVLLAPVALPLLPPQQYIAYSAALGMRRERLKSEVGHVGPLPQDLGDRFGWPELVETVARVYWGLSPEERAKAGILTGNYGEAGAINLFGPRYGLPRAVSGHQTYYYWGPGGYTGEVLIMLQMRRATAERLCTSVEDGPAVGHPLGMGEEHFRILVCRGLKEPLAQAWPRFKHWN